jgi:hypothetical protein
LIGGSRGAIDSEATQKLQASLWMITIYSLSIWQGFKFI